MSLAVILALAKFHNTLLRAHSQWTQPIDFSDFLSTKGIYLRCLSTVTLRETAIRTWLVFFFVGYAYCLYTSLHNILAIIFVGSGIDEPED